MAARKRLAFDPRSPGARKLAEAARASEPVEVEISEATLDIVGERGVQRGLHREPGDRVTVTKPKAEAWIAAGLARWPVDRC